MNILSALAGLASATGTEPSARGAARDASPDAAGAGLFAALLGRREGQEGSGDLPAPKAASGTSRETAQETADGGLEALLAEAQAALEDPKLADAELAEALVPLVAALGIGLASSIRGRDPLVDGFGLIAFASLTPVIFVMAYGMLF